MKEFVEKLIDRLEKEIPLYTGKIKRIINELSDEYKSNLSGNLTGWIPCSERLPEEKDDVLVWKDDMHSIARFNKPTKSWYSNDFPFDESDEVIAWQPLPEPYKPEQKEIPTKHYEERFNRVV